MKWKLYIYIDLKVNQPDDSSIMYALECNNGEKGTLVDGYGTTADTDTANLC
jgi:hypothetical protein